MSRASFSLKTLLIGVAYFAFSIACFLNADTVWANLLPITTVGILFFAAVAVCYSRGADKAFWLGFAVFGWGYLFLVYGPYSDKHDFREFVGSTIRSVYPLMLRDGPPVTVSGGVMPPTGAIRYVNTGNNTFIPQFGPDISHLMRMGQFACATIFGLVGAFFTARLGRNHNAGEHQR